MAAHSRHIVGTGRGLRRAVHRDLILSAFLFWFLRERRLATMHVPGTRYYRQQSQQLRNVYRSTTNIDLHKCRRVLRKYQYHIGKSSIEASSIQAIPCMARTTNQKQNYCYSCKTPTRKRGREGAVQPCRPKKDRNNNSKPAGGLAFSLGGYRGTHSRHSLRRVLGRPRKAESLRPESCNRTQKERKGARKKNKTGQPAHKQVVYRSRRTYRGYITR